MARLFIFVCQLWIQLWLQVLRATVRVLGERRVAIACGIIFVLLCAAAVINVLATTSIRALDSADINKTSLIVLVDAVVIIVGVIWIFPEHFRKILPNLQAGPLSRSTPSMGQQQGAGSPHSVGAIEPCAGLAGALMRQKRFHGYVRRVRMRQERRKGMFDDTEIQIWNITLELTDACSTRCQVEIRGEQIHGWLEENDEVCVIGTVSSKRIIRSRYIHNITDDADVCAVR